MFVDSHHNEFSSEPMIVIGDPDVDFTALQFIAMDPPKHDLQRAAVAGAVAPGQLAKWESLIRGRIQDVLDDLPVDETFNWVECVSIELTGRMLATLFDIPQEDRHKLTDWSDVATASPAVGMSGVSLEEREAGLMECLAYFTEVWNRRANMYLSVLVFIAAWGTDSAKCSCEFCGKSYWRVFPI